MNFKVKTIPLPDDGLTLSSSSGLRSSPATNTTTGARSS